MNIFVTSNCPYESARVLDDKRVVKMTLESCQILSTVMSLYGDERAPYRPTHENHPCVQWAAENINNFKWLVKHFQHLLYQYEYRYQREHACFKHLQTFYKFAYQEVREYEPPGNFVNCTPHQDKPVHLAYKTHMAEKWKTDKRTPTWFKTSARKEKVND